MDIEGIRQLKQEVLRRFVAPQFEDSHGVVGAQHVLAQPTESRIAIGIARITDTQYRLEIRVYRRDRKGHALAEQIAAHTKHEGVEANIEVIPHIRVPTKAATLETPIATSQISAGGVLEIGMSVCHRDGYPGTLGAFVEKDGHVHILSNSHVLALSGAVSSHDEHYIYHPGNTGGRANLSNQRIALLRTFTELSGSDNSIDAAIAEVLPAWRTEKNRIPIGRGYENEGELITMYGHNTPIQRDRELCKIGRSSAHTVGVVRAFELTDIAVEFSHPQSRRGTYVFNNLLEIRGLEQGVPFSIPGDSGSLVYTRDTREAVGLVFAGGQREDDYHVTYCCNLREILSEFDCQLLSE